jgi:cell division protein FtsN
MDPNKPMYPNRDAAREANKEVTEKAAARTTKPEDADPLGQAIAGMKDAPPAKPATPAATPTPTPAPAPAPAAASNAGSGDYIYYLQAGAFRDMSGAEAARAKLALLGFEAVISDRTSDSGVLHLVRLGPYNQAEAMNKARAKLLDSGVDVAPVRTQR